MRLRLPLRPIATAFVASAVALGAAEPSSAALRDWWPFGRSAPAEAIPDPVPYTVTLTVIGADSRLEKQLRRASGLVERAKTPASGLTGLIARARQDVATLTAVLYENARYGGQIAVTLDGRPLDSVGPFDTIAMRPVPVTVTITTGPEFVFGRVETSDLPEGVSLDKLGLTPGKPAKSDLIVKAEAEIANGWREQGHPLVVIGTRDTVADHRTNTLDVSLHIDPGPTARFGRVSVTGTNEVNPDLVLRRAGIDDGPYSSTTTRRAETRLRDLGVFDSVRVTPGDALDPDGTIPITIAVSERKKHVIGGSVTYSNTEGAGVEVYWRNRNLFGGAEQLEFTASVSRLLQNAFDQPDFRLATTFKKPAVLDPMTDFTLRAETYRRTTDAYRVTAAEGEVGLTHIFSDVLSGSVALEVSRSQTVSTTGVDDHLLTTLTGTLDWDARDNRLDPTKGYRATLMAAPAYDFLKGKPFATFRTDFAAYRSFGEGDRFVLAGRVSAATLIVDDVTDVAADRRLYAGGAGSVRGYAYKNIGPRDSGGNIVGGRSSLLFSGELRYRINDQFGVAAFIDAGNAYAGMVPTFDDLKVGIGAGIRYLTPIGPIRLDIAVPLMRGPGDPSVGIYVGLGQAF
ncbi:MAG TPA: autotransporter assembly complex family protein [Bauldia sp.]|nr:autotransporter assembly complex family protein [Bauldia sp.]